MVSLEGCLRVLLPNRRTFCPTRTGIEKRFRNGVRPGETPGGKRNPSRIRNMKNGVNGVPLPPRSGRGFILKHKDGRYCRTYHHNPHHNGKVLVYYEKTEGKKDWSDKGFRVSVNNLKFVGFID